MREIAVDVERHAVERNPALDPDADRRDLVLASDAFVRPLHPDADSILAPLAGYAERRERADDPFFERGDEPAHIRAAALEVEHDIDHPLAGAVIGELAAAPGRMDGKARLDQLLGLGAGAGGVERGMLDQPDELGRRPVRYGGGARIHDRECGRIVDQAPAGPPFDRRRGRGGGRSSRSSRALTTS